MAREWTNSADPQSKKYLLLNFTDVVYTQQHGNTDTANFMSMFKI